MSTPLAVQQIRNRLIRIGAITPPKPVPIVPPPRHREQTLALYRTLRRQAKKIKFDAHLRDWYLDYFENAFRKNREVMSEQLLRTKLARARRELRCLQEINGNSAKGLDRALSYAYARTGPTRHKILDQILAQPSPSAPPLLPNVPRSAPPRYPPLLTHLLTNTNNTTAHPVETARLAKPASLPARVDPQSEEAHLYGPLSRRRERNIRWRQYSNLVQQVNLPLGSVGGQWAITGISEDVVERLERLARGEGDDGSKLDRWARRAYRKLLARVPITRWFEPDQIAPLKSDGTQEEEGNNRPAKRTPKASYRTRISPLALSENGRGHSAQMVSHTLPLGVDTWIRRGMAGEEDRIIREKEAALKRPTRTRMRLAQAGGRRELEAMGELFAPDVDWKGFWLPKDGVY